MIGQICWFGLWGADTWKQAGSGSGDGSTIAMPNQHRRGRIGGVWPRQPKAGLVDRTRINHFPSPTLSCGLGLGGFSDDGAKDGAEDGRYQTQRMKR